MLGENLIAKVKAREIIDSRGNPTVLTEVMLCDGSVGEGVAPSGASTGAFEAVELRDGDKDRYNGKGVQKAVENVNKIIAENIRGENPFNQRKIDSIMMSLDGTENKSKLGANAILATSLAVASAAAKSIGHSMGYTNPLYMYVGGVSGNTMPMPMMNIINGGAHADNSLDVQEFMIVPVGAKTFSEGLRWCTEVYQNLKNILKSKGLSTAVGDEGGFAPNLKDMDEAISVIKEAVEASGYSFEKNGNFNISLDVAASEWKDSTGSYCQPKSNKKYTTDELIGEWEKLIEKYPVFSLEDPLDEEDWEGWKKLTEKIGDKVVLVGDDLFVTNPKRLMKGIEMKAGNAILIKPNQIGSLSETIEAVKMARRAGFKTIMSHRSGETEDTAIADLAVGLNAGYIKTGAPCRSERVAKYNRLLKIEEELNDRGW